MLTMAPPPRFRISRAARWALGEKKIALQSDGDGEIRDFLFEGIKRSTGADHGAVD
jgi:hypothetical protein